MAKKTPAVVSEKGKQYVLRGGPHDGLKVRLGHGLPHYKGTPSKRVPLPERITFQAGDYVRVGSVGDEEYVWNRNL